MPDSSHLQSSMGPLPQREPSMEKGLAQIMDEGLHDALLHDNPSLALSITNFLTCPGATVEHVLFAVKSGLMAAGLDPSTSATLAMVEAYARVELIRIQTGTRKGETHDHND